MAAFKGGTVGAFKTLHDQHAFDLGELVKLIRANLGDLDRTRVGNQLVLDM